MKVQVTGLPGAGKTTGIDQFMAESKCLPCRVDIRDFIHRDRETAFRRALLNSSGDVIAESACGVGLTGTFVIRLNPDPDEIYQNLLARDGFVDEDYLSLLKSEMIDADCVVSTQQELVTTLSGLFWDSRNEHRIY